jgi:hypothetical protein
MTGEGRRGSQPFFSVAGDYNWWFGKFVYPVRATSNDYVSTTCSGLPECNARLQNQGIVLIGWESRKMDNNYMSHP